MNHLEGASSAYLRQHATNPVDWWPWGVDALALARSLDRPIFLSVGYAACHWCHVMAHESFEDSSVAALLNESYVAIKVDREERPDIDAVYMAATQLVSGHGGWPMSVFLLPDGRPFMAGTYYPPRDRPGHVGFATLLRAIADAWANQRDVVTRQAGELEEAIGREVTFIDHLTPLTGTIDLARCRATLRDELVGRVDEIGGFGDAPKFPRPSYVDALLEFDDHRSRDAIERTLDAMSRRGLYDHLRGGFARYSVDDEWHVPHFEKMLSDQALLARCYFDAARTFVHRSDWRTVACDTLQFVLNDLRVDAGFASSLDADAGGHEGSHVTWTVEEVATTLADAGLSDLLQPMLTRLRITTPGAFESRSIPRLVDGAPYMTPLDLAPAMDALRAVRQTRVQPGRDEKVILEWNAMFASTLLRSNDPAFVAAALGLLENLAGSHRSDRTWWRTERRGAHATAADIAWLLDAHVDAYEATGDDRWLLDGRALARYLLEHYWDGEVPSTRAPQIGAGLFSVSDLVDDLAIRPKEIFDGATPSSHAVACRALARLALVDADPELMCVARRLVELAAGLVAQHPGAVPDLVAAAGYALEGVEVVVPGIASELSEHVRSLAMPRTVLVTGSGSSPLLAGRVPGRAYVCRNGTCLLPATTTDEVERQLREALR